VVSLSTGRNASYRRSGPCPPLAAHTILLRPVSKTALRITVIDRLGKPSTRSSAVRDPGKIVVYRDEVAVSQAGARENTRQHRREEARGLHSVWIAVETLGTKCGLGLSKHSSKCPMRGATPLYLCSSFVRFYKYKCRIRHCDRTPSHCLGERCG
jgi:hypothetical protein